MVYLFLETIYTWIIKSFNNCWNIASIFMLLVNTVCLFQWCNVCLPEVTQSLLYSGLRYSGVQLHESCEGVMQSRNICCVSNKYFYLCSNTALRFPKHVRDWLRNRLNPSNSVSVPSRLAVRHVHLFILLMGVSLLASSNTTHTRLCVSSSFPSPLLVSVYSASFLSPILNIPLQPWLTQI